MAEVQISKGIELGASTGITYLEPLIVVPSVDTFIVTEVAEDNLVTEVAEDLLIT